MSKTNSGKVSARRMSGCMDTHTVFTSPEIKYLDKVTKLGGGGREEKVGTQGHAESEFEPNRKK